MTEQSYVPTYSYNQNQVVTQMHTICLMHEIIHTFPLPSLDSMVQSSHTIICEPRNAWMMEAGFATQRMSWITKGTP